MLRDELAIKPYEKSSGELINGKLKFAVTNPVFVSADSRDFCMHESFSARCQHGSLVLMLSAFYGRMRLGRCISGDFNIGCSTDVISYFDAQCTGKRSCDVSVRNLIDIHPCQRDFTSYLDASYKCVQGMSLSLDPVRFRMKQSRIYVFGIDGRAGDWKYIRGTSDDVMVSFIPSTFYRVVVRPQFAER